MQLTQTDVSSCEIRVSMVYQNGGYMQVSRTALRRHGDSDIPPRSVVGEGGDICPEPPRFICKLYTLDPQRETLDKCMKQQHLQVHQTFYSLYFLYFSSLAMPAKRVGDPLTQRVMYLIVDGLHSVSGAHS